uniref:Uncharacterized protein n=1 Tax=Anabas testudineus TaxID=64144 RepID=A0A7N6BZM9_ANATE
ITSPPLEATVPAQAHKEENSLYVYEYLLHVGAQKSAQTFLSEIRWEKNITLGEPPGFLHSWWCVFWDLYCAAPERRDTCEHSSEAKAFHDYSAAAAPSPVLGNLPPGEGMPVGPVPPGFFQPFMSPRYPGGPRPPLRLPNQGLGGVPGSQAMLTSGMDPTRQQGHPNMGGPMQRMTPPRGMVPLGPQSYGGGMRPPLNALLLLCCASTQNLWLSCYFSEFAKLILQNVKSFVYGVLCSFWTVPLSGSGDMDSLPKNSPGNLSMSNQPGTPREDGEMGGNFLNPFQNESYSPNMTMSV